MPDDEEELAVAIVAASAEVPDGFHFECHTDRRYLEVETHGPDEGADRLLVAVCHVNTRGPAFGKQISELEQRAGEIPAAIVRTTNFPRSGKAREQIARMLKRDGRTVVVADADWRRMLAFEAFRVQHGRGPDFAAWQKDARPLGELASLQRIRKLGALAASPRTAGTPRPVATPPPRPRTAPPAPQVSTPVGNAGAGPLVLGRTVGYNSAPVTFDPDEFVQHAAFLGGSGSGKTAAALNLIEPLLGRGVPAVLLDRKGNLCRFCRTFDDPGRPAESLVCSHARGVSNRRVQRNLLRPSG